VYPPTGDKDEIVDGILAVATGEDPALTERFLQGEIQSAVSSMFSYISILNVPPDYVSIIVIHRIYHHSFFFPCIIFVSSRNRTKTMKHRHHPTELGLPSSTCGKGLL
jgi:hypothetical protein